jgi:putative transposase
VSRFPNDSLTFKQYGNSFNVLAGTKKNKATLVLARVVKRTPPGKWFVSISVEVEAAQVQAQRLPPSDEAVGIDVGLKTFAYLSTGEEVANPRFFRAEEAALARAQRKLSKAPKGSKFQKPPARELWGVVTKSEGGQ